MQHTIVVEKKDPHGDKITHIYHVGKNIALYIAGENLKLYTKSSDPVEKEQHAKLVALLTSIRAETEDFKSPYEKYQPIVASALLKGITVKGHNTTKELKIILDKIKRIKISKARIMYWLSIAVPFMVFFSVYCYYEYDTLFNAPLEKNLVLAFKCALYGMLGGTISATFQIHNLNLDIESPQKSNIVLALSRVFLAAASGFASFFIINSGLFGLLKTPVGICGYYSIAIIAGFSEKYIPNLLISWEKKQIKN
ncbi:hypothetical protein [Maridesulfovibrio sp.]|uniref:hypothetical protein n=1 Tax=Maridesulfovibrio sp. TaxID=2795000 RepID=UPI0029F4DA06|nr:hypothetical protein [Maridesulfovibrio sp.]